MTSQPSYICCFGDRCNCGQFQTGLGTSCFPSTKLPVAGSKKSSGSKLRPIRPQTTHIFSRPNDSTKASSSTIRSCKRSNVFFRVITRIHLIKLCNRLTLSVLHFWNRPCTGMYGQGTPLDSSISEEIKALANSLTNSRIILRRTT